MAGAMFFMNKMPILVESSEGQISSGSPGSPRIFSHGCQPERGEGPPIRVCVTQCTRRGRCFECEVPRCGPHWHSLGMTTQRAWNDKEKEDYAELGCAFEVAAVYF